MNDSAKVRPNPICHKWQGAIATMPNGDVGHATAFFAGCNCLGSACSAFISMRDNADPNARLGVCGLVREGAVPWVDVAAGEVSNG